MRALVVTRGLTAGWAIALTLLIAMTETGAAAEPRSEEEILARIQALDLRIQRRIELARLNLERGALDCSAVASDARRFSANVEALEAAVRGLAPSDREVVAAKVHALALEVSNLRLAAEGTFAPPARQRASRAHRVGHAKTMAPPNDLCTHADLAAMGGVYVGDSSAATNDGQASCGASMLSPDVWFRYVAAASGQVAVDTLGSSYDTVLSVHTACPGTFANQLECNDDIQGLQSGVSFWADAGQQYLIRLAGMNGAIGAYQLSVGNPATISGEVTRTDAGDPVYGDVGVWSVAGASLGFGYISAGQYAVDWLPSGTYYLTTIAYPYGVPLQDELWDDIPCPGGAPDGCDPLTGDPLTVTAGGHQTGVDFVLDACGGIRGTVTDSGTGSPVTNAWVRVWSDDGSWVDTAWPEPDGHYEIRLPQPGTYFVTVSGTGFDDVLYDGIPCPGGPPNGCDPAAGTPVQVAVNALTEGIDFAVDTRGRIAGVVRDSTGSPLPWADVELFASDGGYAGYTSTESDGSYAFVGLEDGLYFLTAEEWGYTTVLYDNILCPPGCDVTAGTPVVVSSGGSMAGVDFALEPLGSISGLVLEAPSGPGTDSVPVTVYDASGAVAGSTYTYPGDTYLAYELWAGTYFVVAGGEYHLAELYDDLPCAVGCDPLTGTPVPVDFDQQTTGIDFTLVPKGSISGTVVDQATGEEIGVEVAVYDQAGHYVDSAYSGSGGYRVPGLADGTYFVVIAGSYWAGYLEELYDNLPCWEGPPEGCDPTSGAPVVAAAGNPTTGIDFALLRRGEITGTVLDAGGASPGYGSVRVVNAAGDEVASAYWSEYAPTYTASGLAPGSYVVIADSDSSHRDEVWQDLPCDGEYPEHCSHAAGTLVELPVGGVVSGIDFTLDRLGAMQGVVLDQTSGEPLEYVDVAVYNVSGSRLGSVFTSSSGEWEWSGAWPGVFFAVTDDESPSHFDQLFNGIPCPGGPGVGCTPGAGTPIPLSYNVVTSGVDFHLPRSGGIAGRVVADPSGAPIAGLSVTAWDSTRTLVALGTTDSSGFYELRGLPTGTYFVATQNGYWNGLLDELFDDIPCLWGPPDGCDPTKGTPIAVVEGSITRFVDLALQPWGGEGIAGTVTEQGSGQPVEGVAIDFWDSTGEWRGATMSGASGAYLAELSPGTYRVTTDNPFGYLNEIFDDLPCPGGSAYSGACDPLLGDPVVVTEDAITGAIDFALAAPLPFADGFETSDTSAWSLTVP
ncbi:MAG TPA: carboxypeptidase-like regulatory domain-containing protein [Thermoanaerobaculales bacterium]|nr:carboxypeptidase-like regulatory domain-containing protein [Thermoanaerobaculales bacterium]